MTKLYSALLPLLCLAFHANAQINVSSNYLQYGNIPVGSSSSQQVTLTAASPVTINSIAIGGSGYSFSPVTLPYTLSACQALTLTITDTPPKAGTFTGTMVVTPSAGQPIYINETGSGVAPSVNLSWQAPTSSQDPITGYNVYRNGASLASVTGTSLIDTAVTAGTSYSYYVTSVDAKGNQSVPSNTVQVTVP